MTIVIKELFSSIKMIKEDKVLLFLSMMPVFIGIFLYAILGGWIYTSVIPWGTEYTQSLFDTEWLGSALGWIVQGLIFILFLFITNWTFVLIVGVLASPFNDLIVQRVQRKIKGEELLSLGQSFSTITSRISFTVFNEVKKLFVILSLSFVSLLLNFIPVLSILSILVQSILLSVNYLDYVWSLNDLSLKECFSSYKKNFLAYTLIGFGMFFLINVPVLNLALVPIILVMNSKIFLR